MRSAVSGTGRSAKRMGGCPSSRENAFQRTKVGRPVLSSRTVHFAAVPTVDVRRRSGFGVPGGDAALPDRSPALIRTRPASSDRSREMQSCRPSTGGTSSSRTAWRLRAAAQDDARHRCGSSVRRRSEAGEGRNQVSDSRAHAIRRDGEGRRGCRAGQLLPATRRVAGEKPIEFFGGAWYGFSSSELLESPVRTTDPCKDGSCRRVFA